jgi:hypothetical protein
MMKTFNTTILGKPVKVDLTGRAMKAMQKKDQPLFVGMELYFSCFIKKIVRFLDAKPDQDLVKVTDNLYLYFRPVQSKSCNIHDLQGMNSPKLIDFNVIKKKALVPGALTIDFKGGKWTGEYIYSRQKQMVNEMESEVVTVSEVVGN